MSLRKVKMCCLKTQQSLTLNPTSKQNTYSIITLGGLYQNLVPLLQSRISDGDLAKRKKKTELLYEHAENLKTHCTHSQPSHLVELI